MIYSFCRGYKIHLKQLISSGAIGFVDETLRCLCNLRVHAFVFWSTCSVSKGRMILVNQLIDGVYMKTTERLDEEGEYSRGLFCYL